MPFFKLLKKSGKFEWTAEADEAFQKLKEYLSTSPILTPPEKREPLLLYIAATTTVVSMAIVVERGEECMYIRYNDLSIILTRCYQNPRPSTHMCKSSSTPS
jgi:dsDNA-binding SOS-regulon protein